MDYHTRPKSIKRFFMMQQPSHFVKIHQRRFFMIHQISHFVKIHQEILHDSSDISFRQDPSGDSSWFIRYLISSRSIRRFFMIHQISHFVKIHQEILHDSYLISSRSIRDLISISISKIHQEILHDSSDISFPQDASGNSSWPWVGRTSDTVVSYTSYIHSTGDAYSSIMNIKCKDVILGLLCAHRFDSSAKVGIATDGLPHPSKVHQEILHDAAAVSFRQDPSGDSSWWSSHLIENNKLVDPVMRNPTPYTLPLNYNTNGRLEPPTQRLWSPTCSLWTTTSAQGPSHISSAVSVINQWGGGP